MKLKNQLNLLATFITAIPCACIIFLSINSYLRSRNRLLLGGSEQVRALDSSNMTEADFNMFIKNVQLLPRDVEIALIDNYSGLIITSPYECNCLTVGALFNYGF